jgi:hypothetical protein
MDGKHAAYSLKAPGRSGLGAPLHLPGRGPLPRVDDHLVQPEATRDEVVGGQPMVAFPAQPPHAKKQMYLDFVLRAHVAAGYDGAADLLTRHDESSDFATDACIYKDGTDPETGTRHLEEIAFEVVSEQNESVVTKKAVQMARRGVRRIFSIWLKGPQRVCEWSPQSQSWRLLDRASSIEDPCLVAPLAVAALLDAAAASKAVVEAMAASGDPTLLAREAAAKAEGKAQGKAEGKAEGKVEGKAEGKAEAILQVLEARGVAVSPSQRQEILGCSDLDRLARWLRRAAFATSADEITMEP